MASKTYAELTVATDLLGGDLLASFRGIGPLKSVTASVAKDYFQGGSVLADGSVAFLGAIQADGGTESLPGIAFAGDLDTGIYRIGANSIGIATGGVLRATIDVNGITATISGNITTATRWATPRNLSLTGDGTATLANVDGSAAVSGALTLATVNANVGSFGGASTVPVITVNGKGLVTGVTTATVSVNNSNWSGTVLAVANGGTGATDAAGIRTAAGLGTIATQAASSVTITGGSVTGVTLSSSNATITGGSISGITDLAVADGGTGASSLTDAAVLVGNGTSAIQAVSGSTAGDVLKWVGGGSDPAFGPVTSVFTQLGTSTVSSPVSAVTFTSISASYGSLLLAINGASHNSGSAQNLQFYVSVDNGSNWSFNPLLISQGENAGASLQGGVSIAGYRTARPVITGTAEVSNPAPDIVTIGSFAGGVASVGVANLTPPINAIKIQFTGGSVDAGTFTLYGV